MSRQFDAAIGVALEVERELIALQGDRLSCKAFIAECLSRGNTTATHVEALKNRLADEGELMPGCRSYVREVAELIGARRSREPPARERIAKLDWNGRDDAVVELQGPPSGLFLLWVVAAETAAKRYPGCFGTIQDLEKHKSRIAEIETKRAEVHQRILTSWTKDDVHIGRITSDGAALVTFAKAPGEVPLWPFPTAGQRLVEYLLRKEAEAEAKGA